MHDMVRLESPARLHQFISILLKVEGMSLTLSFSFSFSFFFFLFLFLFLLFFLTMRVERVVVIDYSLTGESYTNNEAGRGDCLVR